MALKPYYYEKKYFISVRGTTRNQMQNGFFFKLKQIKVGCIRLLENSHGFAICFFIV
ncbi:hypothetical protein FEDK69T_31290 [Flavobacterium enshiense DK69]|nr:hypothetical protein FEDK69T_31290 [Flavobacterium enshiense DK69]